MKFSVSHVTAKPMKKWLYIKRYIIANNSATIKYGRARKQCSLKMSLTTAKPSHDLSLLNNKDCLLLCVIPANAGIHSENLRIFINCRGLKFVGWARRSAAQQSDIKSCSSQKVGILSLPVKPSP